MIRYFISYSHQNEYGFGTGNCEISLQRPITSMQDVAAVQTMLRREGIGNPVVMSFCRFDDATSAANRPGVQR